MFCSSCGKTLRPGDTRCAHCGAPVGESRFEGVPYTSAQARIMPGGSPYAGGRAYTRTTYNGIDAEATEADARTTYRPVYEGSSVPEEIRDDVRTVVRGEEEVSEEVQETVDRIVEEEFGEPVDLRSEAEEDPDLVARPIESRGQSGISSDVSEYMQKLESERERKTERRGARMAAPAQEKAAAGDGAAPEDVFSENYDAEEEDEEFEERARLSGKAVQIIKIVAVILVVAALVVGGIMWIRHVSDKAETAPIEGVSLELYNAGIETITAHADSAYVQGLLEKYQTDGILIMTNQLEADANAFAALTPAEPSINDALFIDALESIQTNIGNAVTMDALALAQPSADAEQTSEARWQVISAAIANLKAATTTTELQAIVNGEKISIQTASPTPSPTPVVYSTLTRGDENEDVLRMQNRLWELGFLQDDRDGNFGGNTYTAVKAFQQTAGLDVTGIADSRMLTLLYSDDAPRTQFAQPTGTPVPTAAPTVGVAATPQATLQPAATDAPDAGAATVPAA